MNKQYKKDNSKINFLLNDELILVVKRSSLNLWQGLKIKGDKSENDGDLLTLINLKKEFHWRSKMETDENYKQIIPYLIFKFEESFFIMQRKDTASEQRLKNLFSLGIGGHIKESDITSNSIFDWAKREFNEEIDYTGKFETTFLGALNDDSNEVGRLHLGVIFLLNGDSNKIKIKSELKDGCLIPKGELKDLMHKMEPWSQIIVQYLLDNV
jgi:predicted NUDIX family phosphoesterase